MSKKESMNFDSKFVFVNYLQTEEYGLNLDQIYDLKIKFYASRTRLSSY